jgi:hypothetical protein
MAQRFKLKQSNALKYGVYSTIGLLPGESPRKFKKHQKDVIDEFRPNGPVEHDIIMTIAGALWRKQNLATFQTAQLARFRYRQIVDEKLKDREMLSSHSQMFVHKDENQAALEEAWRAAQMQAYGQLGDSCEYRDDDFGTIERLMKDLEVVERLDAVVDKCVKRLLMVRGVKALAPP